ncbi:endonuclease/exonuclease/phosphatase family protein [Draconibacterium sp. IB214405]|uniref:endonuclease/exonuclease/phosphatase family protein n=1 Tax=Draconibacterium sp. IB214405 TaxID=3097352 RepID=UPI002A0B71E9|nr:endonuclease/exonuclease/phosphatase family protein [Draconibacterium sp. IB214405]MDX8341237.1 endonuclease/exonuclease/phosphatase family protein [Draconibacterium sp. IB214405]
MKMTKQLLAILTLVLTFHTIPAQNTSDKEITVRVLTFNILHGATTKGDFDLDKIASVIQNTNPDLVAMQEVDFKTNRARNYDLVTELGSRTKMAPLFGIAMPYDGGGYGEGILTKMPILSSKNVPLPHSPENEPRAALQVLVQLESGDTISFIGTHLEHQERSMDRIDQVETINEVFTSCKYPSILAGDLNATPDSEPISILKKYWMASDQEGALTYPSDAPEIKIDYIFFRPAERWQVVETEVICDEIASDHCAFLSVLKLVK